MLDVDLLDEGADGVQHVTVGQGGGVGYLFGHFVHGHFACGLRLGVIEFWGGVVARFGAHVSKGIIYHKFIYNFMIYNVQFGCAVWGRLHCVGLCRFAN